MGEWESADLTEGKAVLAAEIRLRLEREAVQVRACMYWLWIHGWIYAIYGF